MYDKIKEKIRGVTMWWNEKISTLKGVGPKRVLALGELGIETIGDLFKSDDLKEIIGYDSQYVNHVINNWYFRQCSCE